MNPIDDLTPYIAAAARLERKLLIIAFSGSILFIADVARQAIERLA